MRSHQEGIESFQQRAFQIKENQIIFVAWACHHKPSLGIDVQSNNVVIRLMQRWKFHSRLQCISVSASFFSDNFVHLNLSWNFFVDYEGLPIRAPFKVSTMIKGDIATYKFMVLIVKMLGRPQYQRAVFTRTCKKFATGTNVHGKNPGLMALESCQKPFVIEQLVFSCWRFLSVGFLSLQYRIFSGNWSRSK